MNILAGVGYCMLYVLFFSFRSVMENICLICESSKPKLTRSSRVQAVRNASQQRGDHLAEKLTDVSSFFCHKNCISTYCSPDHIKRFLKKRKQEEPKETQPKTKRVRRSETSFQFLKHCLFCGDACEIYKPAKNPSRWREAYLCRTADREGQVSFKDTVLRHAKQRSDKWGNEVVLRANSAVSDLHAADARYHKDCMSKFFSNAPSSVTEKPEKVLDQLIEYLHSNHENIWNSVELHKLYEELGGKQLDRRSLVKYVKKALHPHLLVLSSPGVASILLFRSNASSVAKLRIVDDNEDISNIQATSDLGKKIRSECLSQKLDASTYTTQLSMDSLAGIRGIHSFQQVVAAVY